MSPTAPPFDTRHAPPPRPPKPLALPRRRLSSAGARDPFEPSVASAATRRQITALMAATRSPFPDDSARRDRAAELERSLLQLETQLAERERALHDWQVWLEEQQRELAESEALQFAHEKLLRAERAALRHSPPSAAATPAESAALAALKTALDRQETSLEEARATIKEREAFLDESETTLFAKVQAQQEREIELDQRAEDLAERERRLLARESASPSPAVPIALRAPIDAARTPVPSPLRVAAPARVFDEFNE
ncbi:hypothetical protein K0B96_15000 [Horticoccus luteus]|uniref:Uncharacterized protein n=1 Tax=Horticoccus luteus TaxID=2862869 RepID=A0A8F9TUY4_9BACT|nr:hypothetical protein [Horticoccus luteus]QYM78590.1 hypothetical protein K0B96_15000 [Horticoccus luteus]